MHKIGHGSIIALAIALISVSVSVAATSGDDPTARAFPEGGSPAVPALSDAKFGLPGSTMRLHEAQLHDPFTAVDWWPRSHSLPPPIVLHGHKPSAFACGYCHLPTGQGRPENAVLASLPRDYIVRQIEDMRNNTRNGVQPDWAPTKKMHLVAADVSPSEAADAAAYFATQKYQSLVRVVETNVIPAVEQSGSIYRRQPGARQENLGARIIEVPDDFDRFELRDSTVGYTAYVPPGAIARGRTLAATGGGRTQTCQTCHGAKLAGAIGPPLAGRFPGYIFRQLYAFHTGARHGAQGAPMTAVAERLSVADMIDLSAYLAALRN